MCQKNWQKLALPLPLTLTLTASALPVFCLSQFEILKEPYTPEEEVLGLSCSHAVPVAELSHAA